MSYRPSERGVGLIEVLIALLVLSVGLMGAAGLQVMASRSNHSAFQRSQMTFLAQGMADRMQANPVGVWAGDYNGSYPSATTEDCGGGCAPRQLALHDKGIWSSQLTSLLAADTQADIACSSNGLPYVPASDQLALRPPYGGSCTMTVSWTEQGIGAAGSAANDQARQTFAWEFQP